MTKTKIALLVALIFLAGGVAGAGIASAWKPARTTPPPPGPRGPERLEDFQKRIFSRMIERLQLTTNEVTQIEPVFRKGWEDVHAIQDRSIKEVEAAVKQLAGEGIRVSLFIDADEQQIAAAAAVGAPVIELHTGRYAEADPENEEEVARELARIQLGVRAGVKHGLRVNAGHGLHYTNVQPIAAIPEIHELNIGHAIVAHAIFAGWDNAVREMKAIMVAARVAALHGGAR